MNIRIYPNLERYQPQRIAAQPAIGLSSLTRASSKSVKFSGIDKRPWYLRLFSLEPAPVEIKPFQRGKRFDGPGIFIWSRTCTQDNWGPYYKGPSGKITEVSPRIFEDLGKLIITNINGPALTVALDSNGRFCTVLRDIPSLRRDMVMRNLTDAIMVVSETAKPTMLQLNLIRGFLGDFENLTHKQFAIPICHAIQDSTDGQSINLDEASFIQKAAEWSAAADFSQPTPQTGTRTRATDNTPANREQLYQKLLSQQDKLQPIPGESTLIAFVSYNTSDRFNDLLSGQGVTKPKIHSESALIIRDLG